MVELTLEFGLVGEPPLKREIFLMDSTKDALSYSMSLIANVITAEGLMTLEISQKLEDQRKLFEGFENLNGILFEHPAGGYWKVHIEGRESNIEHLKLVAVIKHVQELARATGCLSMENRSMSRKEFCRLRDEKRRAWITLAGCSDIAETEVEDGGQW